MEQQRGLFITLEGPEGCGKSLQARKLKEAMEVRSLPVIFSFEPGGTPFGQEIRQILLTRNEFGLDPLSELFLFNSSRRELISKIVRPTIDRGDNVVLDRYAVSTLVYQGAGRGLSQAKVLMVHEIMLAEGDPIPDLCFVFDLPIEVGLRRKHAQKQWNRFEAEAEAFHQRVRAGYQQFVEDTQAGRLQVVKRAELIDATRDPEAIHQDVWALVQEELKAKQLGSSVPQSVLPS